MITCYELPSAPLSALSSKTIQADAGFYKTDFGIVHNHNLPATQIVLYWTKQTVPLVWVIFVESSQDMGQSMIKKWHTLMAGTEF